ncbi:phage tail protein (plasmid) [Vibrio campbellii]|nr:phage tail protein [Vibrio campbellii]
MTQQYFTVLTDIGAAALANSIALGRDIDISTFAVGDGGGPTYDPTVEDLKSATDLINKRYVGAIHQLHPDPDHPEQFFIEGVVRLTSEDLQSVKLDGT